MRLLTRLFDQLWAVQLLVPGGGTRHYSATWAIRSGVNMDTEPCRDRLRNVSCNYQLSKSVLCQTRYDVKTLAWHWKLRLWQARITHCTDSDRLFLCWYWNLQHFYNIVFTRPRAQTDTHRNPQKSGATFTVSGFTSLTWHSLEYGGYATFWIPMFDNDDFIKTRVSCQPTYHQMCHQGIHLISSISSC